MDLGAGSVSWICEVDLGAGSGGRPSKIMKTIDSVREVCTFREKACILYGRCAFFKKNLAFRLGGVNMRCAPLQRFGHFFQNLHTSLAFWLFLRRGRGGSGGNGNERPIIVSELYQDGMRIHIQVYTYLLMSG